MNQQRTMGIIIFDMDGTLIDSMEQHASVFAGILRDLHHIPEPFARRMYHLTAGDVLDNQFRETLIPFHQSTFLNDSDTAIDVRQDVEEFWRRVSTEQIKLFPSVDKTLCRLSACGYILFLTSNSRSDIVIERTARTGIARHFRLILGSDMAKPGFVKGHNHFEAFRMASNLSHAEFQRNTMLVGDGGHDIKLGKDAGFVTVGVATTMDLAELQASGADYVISNIGALLDLLSLTSYGERSLSSVALLRR